MHEAMQRCPEQPACKRNESELLYDDLDSVRKVSEQDIETESGMNCWNGSI